MGKKVLSEAKKKSFIVNIWPVFPNGAWEGRLSSSTEH